MTDEISEVFSLNGKEMHIRYWSVSVNERDHLEDPDFDGIIILKRI
jgi:hypothetical protein